MRTTLSARLESPARDVVNEEHKGERGCHAAIDDVTVRNIPSLHDAHDGLRYAEQIEHVQCFLVRALEPFALPDERLQRFAPSAGAAPLVIHIELSAWLGHERTSPGTR